MYFMPWTLQISLDLAVKIQYDYSVVQQNYSFVLTDANNAEGFGSTVTAAVVGIVVPVGK